MDSCGAAAALLILGAHNLSMNPPKPQKVVLIVLSALLLGAWALVLTIAVAVSQTMMDALALIIELAAISP